MVIHFFRTFFRSIHCFEYFGSEKLAEGFIIPFQFHLSSFFYSSYSFILSSINHYNSEISHHLSTFFRLFDCFSGCFFLLTSGESLAELYHGNAVSSQIAATWKNWLGLCIPTVMLILNHHCHHFISRVLLEC